MKKLILSFCLFSFAFCGFSQTDEDNLFYVPEKVEVNQSTEDNLAHYFESEADTVYCCKTTRMNVVNVQSNDVDLSKTKAKIIVPDNRPLNSQEYFEKERQKQLEQTRNLYQYGGVYYADRMFRYGFQVLTQTIFPF
jgi:hypothetical protein